MGRVLPLLAGLAALGLPGLHPRAAAAQMEFRGEEATLRLGGQLDMHYLHASPDGQPDDFLVRRAWITVNAAYDDFIQAAFTYDAMPGVVLDALVRFDFDPAFRLSFGRFKRSFDVFVLNPIGDIPFLERAGTVPGAPACTGVGSVCTYGRLSEGLLFSNRDTGIRVQGTLGRFGYDASLTNGMPVGARDVNDGKSVATRLTWAPSDDVEIGLNGTYKDFPAPGGDTEFAMAWGPEFTVGTWRDGLHVQGGFLTGDNWRSYQGPPVPGAEPGGPGTFVTAQVQATYWLPTDAERIEGVEPLFRISVADPDDGIDDDGGLLITPGFAAYFRGRNRVSLNLDWYDPAAGDAVWALRVGTLLFY